MSYRTHYFDVVLCPHSKLANNCPEFLSLLFPNERLSTPTWMDFAIQNSEGTFEIVVIRFTSSSETSTFSHDMNGIIYLVDRSHQFISETIKTFKFHQYESKPNITVSYCSIPSIKHQFDEANEVYIRKKNYYSIDNPDALTECLKAWKALISGMLKREDFKILHIPTLGMCSGAARRTILQTVDKNLSMLKTQQKTDQLTVETLQKTIESLMKNDTVLNERLAKEMEKCVALQKEIEAANVRIAQFEEERKVSDGNNDIITRIAKSVEEIRKLFEQTNRTVICGCCIIDRTTGEMTNCQGVKISPPQGEPSTQGESQKKKCDDDEEEFVFADGN